MLRTLTQEQFPPLLREIPDPPKLLHIEGELPSSDTHTYLAVVGSRAYTPYGKEALRHIIGGLAGYPFVIVSGLALGIDRLAHESALDNNLKTVAVPGSGISRKVIYPRAHVGLADRIVREGGALLSEFPIDEPAAPYYFPQRNRIMAGMCHATLVIEAGVKSGTLITARLATDYNRDVLAVPGSIFEPTAAGTNGLIKAGAYMATEAKDLILHFGYKTKDEAETAATPKDISKLLPHAKLLYLALDRPADRDTLIRESGLSIHEAMIALTMLEIDGYIRTNGQHVCRAQ